MTKIAILGAVLLAAAIFENLGDAVGYIVKSNGWGQYALAIGAMAVYGILTVTVGRGGWSFTQAFPLGYLFVYFIVGLFRSYVGRPSPNRFSSTGSHIHDDRPHNQPRRQSAPGGFSCAA